ncbi:MAG: quinate 5-dehydrogenase [Anaerolineaceae bacterium]
MKSAVSVSIGSSKRDKQVDLELLGEQIHIERIGTNGDMQKAAQIYRDLEGKVQAFGVGGADLGLLVDSHWYPLYSIHSMVQTIKYTPVVDGTGLKITLERRTAPAIADILQKKNIGKRVLVVSGVDRWGLASSFHESGYECVFGDMMFSLGLPFALRKLSSLKKLAAILMPVAGRLPFKWVYPIGKAQEKQTPKWVKYYHWADIIAGDCHYIRRYMPLDLHGKVIVTNTTTPEDVEIYRQAGVLLLVTTTPVLDGRSFGTNMMEAAIVAALGRTAQVDYANPGGYFEEISQAIDKIGLAPQVQEF